MSKKLKGYKLLAVNEKIGGLIPLLDAFGNVNYFVYLFIMDNNTIKKEYDDGKITEDLLGFMLQTGQISLYDFLKIKGWTSTSEKKAENM